MDTSLKPSNLYHYKAYVTRVYSGHHCRVDIDLGMDIWKRAQDIEFNLFRSPEIKPGDNDPGTTARDFLRKLILDKEVLIRSIKDRSTDQDRFFVEMMVVTQKGEPINVCDTLVAAGHAERIDTNL